MLNTILLALMLTAGTASASETLTTINLSADSTFGESVQRLDSSFSAARNGTTATGIRAHYLDVGQYYSSPNYGAYRSFISIPIPASVTVLACTLFVQPYNIYHYGTFNIVAVPAPEWRKYNWFDTYNDFTGWASSGTYSITALSDSLAAGSSMTQDTWYGIVFNAAGRTLLSEARGDTARVVLLSTKDIGNVTNADHQYVTFKGPFYPTIGWRPYVSLRMEPYIAPAVAQTRKKLYDKTPTPLYDKTPIPLYKGY